MKQNTSLLFRYNTNKKGAIEILFALAYQPARISLILTRIAQQ